MTLPPDPDNFNSDRAKWADDAIVAFMFAAGTEPDSDTLQDLYQSEMENDGYFEPLDNQS